MDCDSGHYVPLIGGEAEALSEKKAIENVVVGTPVTRPAEFGTLPFRSGIFDVCADPDICCYGFFCTPCLYGQNVRQLKELNGKPGGSCFSPCCSVMALSCVSNLATCAAVQAAGMYAVGGAAAAAPSTAMAIERLAGNLGDAVGSCVGARRTSKSRTALRQKFGIEEHPWLSDFWAHFWCCACAVCQEAREIRSFMSESAMQRQMTWDAMSSPPGQQEMVVGTLPVDVTEADFSTFTPAKAKPC